MTLDRNHERGEVTVADDAPANRTVEHPRRRRQNPSMEPRPPICLTTYSTHDLRTPALTAEYGEIEYGGLPVTAPYWIR